MKARNPIRPMRIVERRRTYLPHILAIGLLWAGAMTMDYQDQAAAADECAAEMTRQFAECLNGRWIGSTPSGEQVGCLPAETLKLTERTTRKERM